MRSVAVPGVALLVTLGVVGISRPARACSSVPECSLSLGIGRLDPKIAAVGGAAAASLLTVGALLSEERERADRPMPEGVVTTYDTAGKPHLTLTLIPTPPPVGTELPQFHDAYANQGAFQFNDAAATAVIAVGGAAILASVIAGLVEKH